MQPHAMQQTIVKNMFGIKNWLVFIEVILIGFMWILVLQDTFVPDEVYLMHSAAIKYYSSAGHHEQKNQ